ncbi:MAG: polysulfide reductase NrfD [Alphaproteobacteria bacterium]|nr:polysulfide reductase NrfD [Alphaproteobacteria bacterium]
MSAAEQREFRVIAPGQTIGSITDAISDIVLEEATPFGWWIGFGISVALFLVLVAALSWLFVAGIGVWGIQNPVAWGFAIANYVWWIGLASGGTIISALFFLTRSEWRTATNRIAESMMLFCAAAAGIMPIIHLGRWWYFYWLFPYPNAMGTWPQFRSPLHWDFVALLAYVVASILFWYIGLIPDLATLRDRARGRRARLGYAVAALGWRGSSRQWRHFRATYLVFAGLMAPLVCSVHSIVGLDFAGGLWPGWHSTQFPPYFVFGAVLSGFALVLILVILLRHAYGLQAIITMRHVDVLAKLTLTCTLLIAYAYLIEAFMPFYSGNAYERTVALADFAGRYAWAYWGKITLNVVVAQLLWVPAIRRNQLALIAIAAGIIVGMWLERMLIVIGSLYRGFLPANWIPFVPTVWDWLTLIGSIGLFLTGFFLFLRFIPIVTMFELRELVLRKEGASR